MKKEIHEEYLKRQLKTGAKCSVIYTINKSLKVKFDLRAGPQISFNLKPYSKIGSSNLSKPM